MRKFGVVNIIFVGKRNDEVTVVFQRTFPEARGDLGFDPVDNLIVERPVVI